jgi:SAM-dependent methyltransferase
MLDVLYEYDDFMESVDSVLDLGCGTGEDLEWWATRTTRDNDARPLNIKCTGIDLKEKLAMAQKYKNIQYQRQDFEKEIVTKNRYDILWCHDAFQYVIDPIGTLKRWKKVCSTDGALMLMVPQTTNIEFNIQAFDQVSYCYYNWTMVSLIHVLAVAGWDCRSGFFKKDPGDPWLYAVVYNIDTLDRDPRNTSWYDLAEAQLLPESAEKSVQRHGFLRQQDLVLPWLDKSIIWMGNH